MFSRKKSDSRSSSASSSIASKPQPLEALKLHLEAVGPQPSSYQPKAYFNLLDDADVDHLVALLQAEGAPMDVVLHGAAASLGGDVAMVKRIVPALAMCRRLVRLQVLACNLSDASAFGLVDLLMQGAPLVHVELQDNSRVSTFAYTALHQAALASEQAPIRTMRLWDVRKKPRVDLALDVVAARKKMSREAVLAAGQKAMQLRGDHAASSPPR